MFPNGPTKPLLKTTISKLNGIVFYNALVMGRGFLRNELLNNSNTYIDQKAC